MAGGLWEYIEGIRTFVSDTFNTFPLIMIGFIFLFGTLTSNPGLLFLFLGHLVLVPSLGFVTNETGPAWFQENTFSLLKLAKWLFSTLLVVGVNAKGLGGGSAYYLYLIAFISFVGQFIMRKYDNDVSPIFFMNPVAWFSDLPEKQPRASLLCSMIPNSSNPDDIYNSPSSWLAHIIFFFGFFITNATAIYNEPVPILTDPNSTPAQQAGLDTRVANRKWMATSAMVASVVILITLVFFRYSKTPCESRFLYNLIPLVAIGFTGAAWFNIVYHTCGVRPADILGIVQGFLSPNMIDTPVVCIGSE